MAMTQAPVLTPLTSIRFLAAVQLFLFHMHAFHKMQAENSPFVAFDSLPLPLIRLIERGFCSTSLFFLLSGFILAYLYLDPSGQVTVSRRNFWIARLSRIYPLHLLLMLLLAFPVIQFAEQFGMTGWDVAISGVLCAGLLQAWVPQYALAWNFPTWALSVVMFYYLIFPWVARRTQSWSRRSIAIALAALPLISLVPSLPYIALTAGTTRPLFDFWSELLMRNPLLWAPHFVLGVLLARYFDLHRHGTSSRTPAARRGLSWGDVSFVALVAIEMFVTEIPAGWVRDDAIPIHNFLLRHGPLAPLYYVLLHDLAFRRGILARLLSLPGLRHLGEASFSIFMLQLPGLILFPAIGGALQLSSGGQIALCVVGTLGLSLASTYWVERPLSRALRRRWERHAL